MKEYKIISDNMEDTLLLGNKLGKLAYPGLLITLEGDLGAGKTTFTKGIAVGLDIDRVVKSPTFTIIREYEGRLPLYHMDVYRLADGDEDLGFDQYFYGQGVSIVEWAHLIDEYLPKARLDIIIKNIDESRREFTFKPKDEKTKEICEVIL